MRQGIFTLDLSTSCTGWCYGVPGGVPRFGSWSFKHLRTRGEKFNAFRTDLTDADETFRPAAYVMESALPLGAFRSMRDAISQLGMLAYTEGETAGMVSHVEGEREVLGVPCYEQDVDTVRKAVVGRCRVFANEKAAGLTMKDIVARALKLRGYEYGDDNQGDAIALWLFACEHMPAWKIAAKGA